MSLMDKLRSWFGGSSADDGPGHDHPHGHDHHDNPDAAEEGASAIAGAAAAPGAGGGAAPQLGTFDPEPEGRQDPPQPS